MILQRVIEDIDDEHGVCIRFPTDQQQVDLPKPFAAAHIYIEEETYQGATILCFPDDAARVGHTESAIQLMK